MFLKNKNIISKFRRSKVTDYAALMQKLRSNIVRLRFLTSPDREGPGKTLMSGKIRLVYIGV